jgi:hypothetical protein
VVFFSPRQKLGQYFDQTMTTFFPILPNSSVILPSDLILKLLLNVSMKEIEIGEIQISQLSVILCLND